MHVAFATRTAPGFCYLFPWYRGVGVILGLRANFGTSFTIRVVITTYANMRKAVCICSFEGNDIS